MRRTPLPHRLTPVYLYFRWDLNPQRFPLGCWFLKPVRFYRFATEAYYFVALVGNDPTTFSMSRKRSPIELQGNLELLTGNDPISLVYKTSASPLMLMKLMRSRLDSNQREWVCNPLPPVFQLLSATGPFYL